MMSQNRLGVPIVPEALTQPEQRNVTLGAGVPIVPIVPDILAPVVLEILEDGA